MHLAGLFIISPVFSYFSYCIVAVQEEADHLGVALAAKVGYVLFSPFSYGFPNSGNLGP